MRPWQRFAILVPMQLISLNMFALDYRPENSRESKNVEDRRAANYYSAMAKCESSVSNAKTENQIFLYADYSVDVDTTGGFTLASASARSGLTRVRSKISTHYERAMKTAQVAYDTCLDVAGEIGESSYYDPLAKDLERKAIGGMAEIINVRLRAKEKFESASREVESFGREIANIQDHTK